MEEEEQNDNKKNSKVQSLANSMTFGNQLSLRVDQGVGAITISPSGRDVALASRSGLFIIDLDDPFCPPRCLPHVTAWEVADVQWSPHASKPYSVISTSNQKAIVWNLSLPANRAIEHVLHGHQRAITDINFHALEPEILATCSIDSFVHIWDLRIPKRPTTSFADWTAGASQVKWNRMNSHILASSHDTRAYVWDDRMGCRPLRVLNDHRSKVNGIDFSRLIESQFLTCSNDFTVKLWDYNQDEPLATINTNFPVWRARHTPFGTGCLIMPLRGGDNNLYLKNLKGLHSNTKLESAHVFSGHSEPVRDFLWRSRGGEGAIEDREFQLVTWSKDHDLRLWPVPRSVLELVDYNYGTPIEMNITRRGAVYETYRHEPMRFRSIRSDMKRQNFMTGNVTANQENSYNNNTHLQWMAGVRIGRSAVMAPFDSSIPSEGISNDGLYSENLPANLGEEVSMTGRKFPRIRFEQISVSTGKCTISLNAPWSENEEDLVFMRVMINFPVDYPFSAPKFELEGDQELMDSKAPEILEMLNTIANRFCSHGRYCLEICLRYLSGDKIDLDDYNFSNNLSTEFDRQEDISEDPDLVFGTDYLTKSEDRNDIIGAVVDGHEDDDDDENDDDDDDSSTGHGEGLVDTSGVIKPSVDSTPLPKGCGAIWSKSGYLVCFFENRKDRSQSNFDNLRSINNRLPRDFGTPQLDESKEFDDSESDSDLDEDDILPFTGYGQFGRIKPNYLLNRLKTVRGGPGSADRSQETHTQTENKNFVRIIDLHNLIPSRKELAAEYLVLGKPPEELAKHNAIVAEKYHCRGIAECWKLLENVLSLNVYIRPGEAADRLTQLLGASGRFDWGSHPFGKSWLIDELFNYFENEQNTQMLAVMSCVLSGPMSSDNIDSVLRSTPYSDVFGSHPFAKSPSNSDVALARESSSGYFGAFSGHQSQLQAPVDRVSSGLIDVTNNRNTGNSSYSSSRDESASVLSMSPERLLTTTKVVGGMGGMGGLFSKASFMNKEISGSISRNASKPQLTLNKATATKSASNLENDFNSNISFVSSGGSNTQIGSHGSLYNPSDSASLSLPKVQVDIINNDLMGTLENIPINAGQKSTPLLDPSKREKYMIYRSQYATILYSWGLDIESLEIQKFNFINPSAKETKRLPSPFDIYHSAQIEFQLRKKVDDPEIIRTRDPVGNRTYARICQYCRLMIKTRFVQCFNCQHVLHHECALNWWDVEYNKECPSGCGCCCLDYMVPT